jgi:hypothetical protein
MMNEIEELGMKMCFLLSSDLPCLIHTKYGFDESAAGPNHISLLDDGIIRHRLSPHITLYSDTWPTRPRHRL